MSLCRVLVPRYISSPKYSSIRAISSSVAHSYHDQDPRLSKFLVKPIQYAVKNNYHQVIRTLKTTPPSSSSSSSSSNAIHSSLNSSSSAIASSAATNPSKNNNIVSKFKNHVEKVKTLAIQYFNGSKQLYKNGLIAASLLKKQREEGYVFNYGDYMMCKKT